MHAAAAAPCRGDQRRKGAAAIGAENRMWRLDHQLERERARGEPDPRLESVEQPHQGRDFLEHRHLGQRDRERRGELAATALHERRHEQLERAGRPRGSLCRERLDPDTQERWQAAARQAGRDLRTGGPRCLVLLLIRAGAEPILEVDSEILDRLALKLLAHAGVQLFVDVVIDRRKRRSERRGIRGVLGQRSECELPPLGREPVSKQVRADVRRVDRSALVDCSHARFPQKSLRS